MEPGVEWRTGSRLGREYVRAVYSHLVCLSCTECFMHSAGLDEAQAGIKIDGRNINNLRYTVDMVLMAESGDRTIMAESEEELKILLVKVKEKSEKAGLKLNIKKTKIKASGPITSWQIDGETMATVADFIFGGLQNHCRW